MVLFFCVVIAGTTGSVYYFNKNKTLYAQLIKTSAALEEAKKADSIKYELFISEKQQHAKDNARNDSLFVALSKKCGNKDIQGVQSAVNAITLSRDSARKYSEIGYNNLSKNKFPEALEAFHKSEQWYNGYRESYEIYFLLWKNKKDLNDPALQTQLLKKIQKDLDSKGFLKYINIK